MWCLDWDAPTQINIENDTLYGGKHCPHDPSVSLSWQTSSKQVGVMRAWFPPRGMGRNAHGGPQRSRRMHVIT